MMLVRRLARPLLASFFIARGVRLLRNPEEGTAAAARVATPLAERVSFLPKDPVSLVRLNAAAQAGFGVLLASGRLPRVSALALTGTALPTAVARHPFWEKEDQAARSQEQTALLSELSIVGGLLLAAVDTGGDPSLAWRARHAARNTRKATGHAVAASRREAKLATKVATGTVKDATSTVRDKALAVRSKLPV
jgi:putative oxidoreductase